MEDNPKIHSLARRISGLAEARNVKIDLKQWSHMTYLNHSRTQRPNSFGLDGDGMGCEGHKGLLVRNPIGWFVDHVNSDFALFRDNGVRYFSKVVMALRPGRKDKNFVAIADRVCLFYKRLLHFCTSWMKICLMLKWL